MTKQELLQLIRAGRSELEQIWLSLSESQINALPGPQPEWTVKDLFAHLTYWEHPTLDKLAGRIATGSWGNVDSVNADLRRRSRLRSTADVFREFIESGLGIMEEIEGLSDEQLQQESPWKDGQSLEYHVSDDTWAHYEHHLKTLRAWVEQNRESRRP